MLRQWWLLLNVFQYHIFSFFTQIIAKFSFPKWSHLKKLWQRFDKNAWNQTQMVTNTPSNYHHNCRYLKYPICPVFEQTMALIPSLRISLDSSNPKHLLACEALPIPLRVVLSCAVNAVNLIKIWLPTAIWCTIVMRLNIFALCKLLHSNLNSR